MVLANTIHADVHFPIDAAVASYIKNSIQILTSHQHYEIKHLPLHIHGTSYHRSSLTLNNYIKRMLSYSIFHFNNVVSLVTDTFQKLFKPTTI